MSAVIVVGSANTDFTVKVTRLPRPGETVSGGDFRVSYGGKGANQAMAARKAGAQVDLLAKIGTDAHGQRLFDHLTASGLPAEGLLRDEREPAGVALIAVDRQGRNQIVVASGSNHTLDVSDLRGFEDRLTEAGLLLCQLEIPLAVVEYALKTARHRAVTTLLNPAPAPDAPLPEDLLAAVDILVPNEVEAEALTGVPVKDIDDAKTAAAVLHDSGCPTVIITMGDRGALVSAKGRSRHLPAFQVSPVDSVAAGDAFCGALAAALVEGRDLQAAARLAAAAGALCTTRRGAQEALPSRREIDEFLARRG